MSDRTVIAAAPITPLALAMTCPVPSVVATNRPAGSIVPSGGETDQLSGTPASGTGL